jgi:hypothetical protein
VANFENVDNVGTWTFHSHITSAKLDLMTRNEEAIHQNKPRTCNQHEGTWELTNPAEGSGSSAQGDEGFFVEITHLQPEYTVLMFGVQVIDTDDFPTGEADSSSSALLFPTGAGIGPFLRPPVVVIASSSFAIPDASGGSDWQTATLAGATDESGPGDWPLTNLGQPFSAGGLDNFKSGLALIHRIAGFDGQGTASPPANSNLYAFWHAIGPVAAFN